MGGGEDQPLQAAALQRVANDGGEVVVWAGAGAGRVISQKDGDGVLLGGEGYCACGREPAQGGLHLQRGFLNNLPVDQIGLSKETGNPGSGWIVVDVIG